MINKINELQEVLFQLQAIIDVTAIAFDEGTPKSQRKIYWSGMFEVAGKLAQQAISNFEELQGITRCGSGGKHEAD